MSVRKLVNYLPILNDVIAHWSKVETVLGDALVLPDGTTHDAAIDLGSALQTAETTLLQERNLLATAQGVRDTTRRSAHEGAKQARKSLRGLAKNAPEVLGLPALPAITTAPASLLALYTDIASIWSQVNALPPARVPAAKLPLRIPLMEDAALVQVSHAQFVARIEALRSASASLANQESTVTEAQAARDALHQQVSALVKDYRAVVQGLLPEGHPLLKTIPTLR